MSGYEVFFISGSPPCWRVMLAMEVKGLGYEATRFDNAKGEQKNPEFLKINPRGHVPVLRNGETVVTESLAILAYLDRAHPEPALFGATAVDAGAIWQQILDFEASTGRFERGCRNAGRQIDLQIEQRLKRCVKEVTDAFGTQNI